VLLQAPFPDRPALRLELSRQLLEKTGGGRLAAPALEVEVEVGVHLLPRSQGSGPKLCQAQVKPRWRLVEALEVKREAGIGRRDPVCSLSSRDERTNKGRSG
jgi:hypothetical protein